MAGYDIDALVRDPDFQRRSFGERKAILREADAEGFGSLPDTAQSKMLVDMKGQDWWAGGTPKQQSIDAANSKAAKGESVFGGKQKPTDTRKVNYTGSGYTPNQPAKSGKEFARNLVQDVVEAPLMPVRMLSDVANSPDTPSTLAELGKGLVRGPLEFIPGAGEALGGRSATEAWSTNPGYGAMTLAGVGAAGKAMRGASKGAGNTLAELKPSGGGLADKTATKLYDMTLKQGTTLKPEIRRQNVREGLEGGYLPNNKGVDKLAADVRATEAKVGEGIKAGAEAGVRGNLGRAIANVEALREQAMRSDNPAKNLALIDAEIEQLQAHPILDQTGTVPIDQLQKMKVEQGRHVKYQEKNGQAVDPFKASIDKARIRGFKEELEVQLADVFPELKDQNAQLSRKYKLQDVLERAANRIENNQGIGIGLPIKGGAGATIGGMMGGPAGAAIGGGIGTLIGIIEHPAVAPRLAIALHRASKGKLTMAQARASANERLDYIKNKMKDERGLVGKDIDLATQIETAKKKLRDEPSQQNFKEYQRLQNEAMALEDQKKLEAPNTDYKGEHTAPSPESGAPLHSVSDNGIYPDDFYGPDGLRYYGTGYDKLDVQSMSIIRGMKGRPNSTVTIYRAIPKDAPPVFNEGDWVSINRQYVKDHGEGALNGEYKIIKKTVTAKDIYTNGDSMHEWGYWPKKKK